MENVANLHSEASTLAELHKEAEKLKQDHAETRGLVLAIRAFIIEHTDSLPPGERYRPKTIVESRFTPVGEAFAKGMTSCGAVASISAEMLQYAGFRVKLIHGETSDSVDHAWISVYDPTSENWTEYDLTRPEADVPPTHTKKLEADSWEDIKEQIHSDHETMHARREEKGIAGRNHKNNLMEKVLH